MTLDEFLDIREKKKISAHKVRDILEEKCGYHAEFIDTHCVDETEYRGKENEYHYLKATCPDLEKLGLPQFAYIKFYCPKDYQKGSDREESIYALVAGKTKLSRHDISFRPPELPDGSRGDKAKWYIKKSLEGPTPPPVVSRRGFDRLELRIRAHWERAQSFA